MWAFDSFPGKLRSPPDYHRGTGVGHLVEVFGYILDSTMVVYRLSHDDDFPKAEDCPINLLPIAEFEEIYKEFKLVE